MNRLPTGFLLVIEGIDGAGKTTISNLLAKNLKHTYSILQTKEPGDSTIGPTVRNLVNTSKNKIDPVAEYLLFAADRAQHRADVLIPALQEGKLILCDRFTDSSIAYQGFGRKISKAHIAQINAWALDGIQPNLTVYIDIPVTVAIERIQQRNEAKTRFEQTAEFLAEVKNGFDWLFAEPSDTRLKVDGTASPETICQKIQERITMLLA